MPASIKIVKAPKWVTDSIDLEPKLKDALEIVGTRLERQGKGLGAQRNTLTRQSSGLEANIYTTFRHPRRTGSALKAKDTRIFNSAAPAIVRSKVLKPIEAEWVASQGGL